MATKYLKCINSVDFENRYWEIFNNLLNKNPDIGTDVLANDALLLTEAGFEKLENRELLADTISLNSYKTIKGTLI